MNRVRMFLASAILHLVAASALAAQDAPAPRRTMELWGGLARGSPSWGVLGQVPGMNLGVVGLRVAMPLGAGDGSRVTEYTIDLIPFAIMSPPYTSLRGTGAHCDAGRLCVASPFNNGTTFPNGSAFGFGASPLGITTRWFANRRLSPSLGFSAGGLHFNRRVPTTKASRFNFTAAIEAAVRIGAPGAHGLNLSYRLHHLSNASTAGENPGLASHVFGLGIRTP